MMTTDHHLLNNNCAYKCEEFFTRSDQGYLVNFLLIQKEEISSQAEGDPGIIAPHHLK